MIVADAASRAAVRITWNLSSGIGRTSTEPELR